MEKHRSLSIIVEGNIGAGKSTFLKMVDDYLDLQIVYEPHEQWQNVNGENVLDHFYKDTKRWAYTFQSFAFVTRVLEQEKHLKESPPLQILERSVYSDRHCFAKTCFESGLMTELEWNMYKQWFSWLVQGYSKKPNAFIYLYTDPEVCYDRMKKRSRSEEVGITLDYLKSLHNKHENWLKHKKDVVPFVADVPVLMLECNEDFENDALLQQQHISKIIEFIDTSFNMIVPQKKGLNPLAKSPTLEV